MAGLGLEAKLAILDQALNRLEGELQNDEHWRALMLPVASADAGASEAAREARNTRLRLALETNPVYRAWKDVKDATESLRALAEPEPSQTPAATQQADAPSAPPTAAVATSAERADPAQPQGAIPELAREAHAQPEAAVSEHAAPDEPGPDGFAAHYELPPDIANLIRAELEAASARQEPAGDSEEEMFAVGTRATRTMDKLLSIPSVEPVGPEQLEAARRHANRTSLRAALRDLAPDADSASTGGASSLERAKPADGHTVPLDADDLAFLLSPTTAPTKASRITRPEAAPKPRVPLMQRLKAEEAVPRPLAVGAPEEAEVTLVRRGAQKAAAPAAANAPSQAPAATEGESTKAMRLSQLLKAWTRP